MRSLTRLSTLAVVLACASPALAQPTDDDEPVASPDAAAVSSEEKSRSILHDGAPTFSSAGWSIKPRGRLQLDAGTVSSPDGIDDDRLGYHDEFRRAYIGVDGKIPGGFAFRAEIDVAEGRAEITDLYLTYQPSKALTFTLGQHKPFWGLEELTSDLFPSFMERAAINTAFGYERRLGASATFTSGDVLLQGGVFTDHVQELDESEDDPMSFDGRAVFAPKVGGGRLHLGASMHVRDFDDSADSARYRVRAFVHTSDIRFIDTAAIPATGETGYGLEAAYITGPFHAAAEAHWQHVDRIGAPDPTFFGSYVEAGVFLTKGDTRGYKGGVFDRVKPARPLGRGGFGAVQVNARYDYLDLNDAGIVGGKQRGYEFALVWTPTAYTRLIANYGRMQYRDAAIPAAGGDRSYGVDAFGVRAQFDF
jgi:phosphate-selective porin OprO/OprP